MHKSSQSLNALRQGQQTSIVSQSVAGASLDSGGEQTPVLRECQRSSVPARKPSRAYTTSHLVNINEGCWIIVLHAVLFRCARRLVVCSSFPYLSHSLFVGGSSSRPVTSGTRIFDYGSRYRYRYLTQVPTFVLLSHQQPLRPPNHEHSIAPASMAPTMARVRSLVARDTEYAMAPFWIVLLVLLGAGFAVLAAYAIGRHFFPPAAVEPTIHEDEQGKGVPVVEQNTLFDRMDRHDPDAVSKADPIAQPREVSGHLRLQRHSQAAYGILCSRLWQ